MRRYKESLPLIRLFMVLSSLTPLFVMWAIQGIKCIDDKYFIPFCSLMVVIPNLVLVLRIRSVKKNNDTKTISIGKYEDHRDHILIYLFAMLLPFYALKADTMREVVLTLVALVFLVFLFWHVNFHYMNIIFAIAGFRIYTIYSRDNNPLSGKGCTVLITRRMVLRDNTEIIAYRLSDSVYYDEVEI